MEMCYDGALVMPSSYAVMDEEEMTYVEGGSVLAKVSYRDITAFLAMTGLSFLQAYADAYAITKLVKKIKVIYNTVKSALAATGWGAIVSLYLAWKGGSFIDTFAECLDKKKSFVVGWGWTGIYFDAV